MGRLYDIATNSAYDTCISCLTDVSACASERLHARSRVDMHTGCIALVLKYAYECVAVGALERSYAMCAGGRYLKLTF